jgi:hypothetical protein
MASGLSSSRLHTESDLRKLRRAIGWQPLGYDGKMRRGIALLTCMQPDDFVYFASYALSGHMFPFSSFLFTLLEHYGPQLQHLSPHSIMLVAIFMHLCEMYMCVWPSMRLFRRFHVLRSSMRNPAPLGGYYSQHQTKGPPMYITALSPSKWDRWREDWVIMQADAHNRLVLPTTTLMDRCSDSEKVPDLQRAYNPVLQRIQFLAEKGLTSMIVLHDFMSKRIAPLQECTRTAWLYSGENDATRLEHGPRMDLEPGVLDLMLSKLSTDPSFIDFITPPAHCMPINMNQAARSLLLKAMLTLDNIDIAVWQWGD